MVRTLIPATSVFAFGIPVVKAGELVLPVRTVDGIHGIRGSVTLWRDAARKILDLVDAAPAERPGSGPKTDPVRLAKYEAILTEVRANSMTQSAACAKHGIKFPAFNHWLNKGRHQKLAHDLATRAPALREPVTKPGGHIL